MHFNRKKFFDNFKALIDDTLEQHQVDGLEFLLGQFEANPRWKNLRHIAYALATAGHETAWSFQPVEEGYYLGSKAKVRRFQNTLRYKPYFGRGFVQLTWKTNYKKAGEFVGLDLVGNPSLALDPKVAFDVMTWGMFGGHFTGKKLSDYINSKITDYKEARRIINGTDKAALIAGYAKTFETILRNSAATSPNSHTRPIQPEGVPQQAIEELPPMQDAGEAGQVEQTPAQDSSQTMNAPATEQTMSAEKETSDGTIKQEITSKNEQSVNETVEVEGSKPYNEIGFWATIKRDLFGIFGTNATVQTAAEYSQQVQASVPASLLTKLAYVIAAASICYLLFRVVHYLVDRWQQNQRVTTKALIDTDITRKNMEWK